MRQSKKPLLSKQHLTPSRSDFIWLGSALAALILIIGLCFASWRQVVTANRNVAHAQQMIQDVTLIRSLITDAETGQRGFLLTDDIKYLEPYEQALDRYRANFKS